jgi:sec-independent protein translocase protein TatA
VEGALAPWHILIVALVLVVLFGSKRLPDAARSLGQSIRILKAETRGTTEQTAAHRPLPGTPDAQPAAPHPQPASYQQPHPQPTPYQQGPYQNPSAPPAQSPPPGA